MPEAIESLVEMVAFLAETGPWLTEALRTMMAGNVSGTVAVLKPHVNTTVLFSSLSIDDSDLSPLAPLMRADPSVYDSLLQALAAGEKREALSVLMGARGADARAAKWSVLSVRNE